MAWPRPVEPSEIRALWAQANWRFSPAMGWGLADAPEPGLAMTLALLSSRSDYWDVHALATGFWSYTPEEDTHRPSVTIRELADDGPRSRLVRYSLLRPYPPDLPYPLEREVRANRALPARQWQAAARTLVAAVGERDWLDQAAIYTVDEFDLLVEECRRRFPELDDDFLRCLGGDPQAPRS